MTGRSLASTAHCVARAIHVFTWAGDSMRGLQIITTFSVGDNDRVVSIGYGSKN